MTTSEWPRCYSDEEVLSLVRGLVDEWEICSRIRLFHYGTGDIMGHAALREHLGAFEEHVVRFRRRGSAGPLWTTVTYGALRFILFSLPYEDLPLHLSHPCPIMGYVVRWRLRLGR